MTRVVVIDDDLFSRDRVTATLHSRGYEAASAPDGLAGVELVREYEPDLVLCDITMPVMDGYQVLHSLRQDVRTADVSFVFMTARAERDDLRQGMQLGADDYLTKPFTNDELIATVNAQLVKRHMITDKYESTIKLLRKNIVYALPHEVRTPLAVGLGYAGLLHSDAEHLAAHEVQQMAEQIIMSYKRLNRLLENFLVYAQIEVLASDPEQLEQIRNHITGHVGKVVEARAWAVADRYLRRDDLVLDVHDFAARIAENDLAKIVDELVENAFKFSQSGSPVRVRAVRDDQDFRIEVADRGRGMADEQIELIGAYMQFDRALFEQQGLGLGLIIAKRLAELHQGRLAIQSKVGIGTAVRISFGSS